MKCISESIKVTSQGSSKIDPLITAVLNGKKVSMHKLSIAINIYLHSNKSVVNPVVNEGLFH